jgi:hypothetical protein
LSSTSSLVSTENLKKICEEPIVGSSWYEPTPALIEINQSAVNQQCQLSSSDAEIICEQNLKIENSLEEVESSRNNKKIDLNEVEKPETCEPIKEVLDVQNTGTFAEEEKNIDANLIDPIR